MLWLLFWGAAAAFAQGSDGQEPASALWAKEKAGGHSAADFNQRRNETLDPTASPNDRWADPCRTVAVSDLREMLLGDQLPEEGIRLVGVRVNGKLDLSNTSVKRPLAIISSRIDGGVDLTQTRLDGRLNLNNVQIDGQMVALGVHALKDVSISGVIFKDKVDLRDARFDGSLIASEATFEKAIDATRLEISHHFFLIGVTLKGIFKLRDAKIGGNFDLEESNFDKAIDGTRIRVVGNMFMNDRARFKGKITLDYASIGGDLEMEGHSSFQSLTGNLRVSTISLWAGSTFHDTVYLPYLHVEAISRQDSLPGD
jgi:hypothetical protein